MKKRRYQKDSVLIKFILSFLLVLILPVFLFSFAYIKYDQKIYQDKLLKQEQDALDLPLQELEQYIEEMKQIAVQTPLRSYVDQKDLMNKRVYTDNRNSSNDDDAILDYLPHLLQLNQCLRIQAGIHTCRFRYRQQNLS